MIVNSSATPIAVEIRSHAACGAGERNHQAECDLHWRSMS
jgi:hypothetical protein